MLNCDPGESTSEVPLQGCGTLLLIGLGNTLRGDDALGPLVAEHFADHPRIEAVATQARPAIIEARLSQTPLLVLTADRPPELRHCHSGQTINQTGLFGQYPVWSAEAVGVVVVEGAAAALPAELAAA